MPLCQLLTNLSKEKIPKDFSDSLVKVIAESTGKPVEHVQLAILPDTMMTWACSSEPTVHFTITAIGIFGEDTNEKYAKAINTFLSEQLNIPLNRLILRFIDAKTFEVAVGVPSKA